MSGLDKIIDHITQEARDEAGKIVSKAKEEAQKLLSDGRNDAQERVKAIKKQSDLDVQAALKRIESAADLQEKRTILQAKQEIIEQVFEKALNKLNGLDDASYFELLSKMAARYSTGEKGSIKLSEKDLKRITEGFKTACESAALSISSEPADISGGFILSYGDIEENCSFDVLIETSREELQDKIGQLMFS